MDSKYLENISFEPMKKAIEESGLKIKAVSEKAGLVPTRLSAIFTNKVSLPMTDVIARIAFVLRKPVSELVDFKGIVLKPYFIDKTPYQPPLTAEGKLTYKPLWDFLKTYLDGVNNAPDAKTKKTADDLFDKIETERKIQKTNEAAIKAALASRGIDENYEPKYKRKRRDYSKGLPNQIRTKLRNDRSISLRTVYDMCAFLGCSVDFIMSYK